MRAHRLLVLTCLTLFAGGCGGAAQKANTGPSAEGEGEEGGGDSSAVATGPAGSRPKLPPPSGPPTATFPGFEVMPDGTSVVTVQVRGPVKVTEQKAEGRLVYVLSGVEVSEKVNQLPLLTQHFPTQVSSVTLTKVDGGANLIIDLREPSPATMKVAEADGISIVSIQMPRSEKYGAVAKPGGKGGAKSDVDKAIDEAGERASGDSGSGDGSQDSAMEAGSDGIPEDADEETERRRKRSKRQPIPYVERSLTVPQKTLAPDIGISAFGFGRADTISFLSGGVRYGIIDQFEIEASPHSFRLSPRGAFVDPSVGITAGYTGHPFEIAGRARYFIGIDTDDLDNFDAGTLLLGVPMAIHLGSWGRIDTGAFLTLDFGGEFGPTGLIPGAETRIGLFDAQASAYYSDYGIPFKFLFQPLPAFWIGPHTGLAIYDFDNVSETLSIPLGGELGITASDDYNPIADLGLKFDLPFLIRPAADDAFVEDAYQVGLWFRWYHHI